MTAVNVTARRTLGQAFGRYTTALAVGAFLALVGGIFTFRLYRSEGLVETLPTLWAVSVSPVLPILAALLSMGVWSDERQTGRMSSLLSVSVRERDLVLGKFFGVIGLVFTSVVLSFLLLLGTVLAFSPALVRGVSVLSFVPAVIGLFIQGALWASASVAASAIFRHSALAALSSIAVLVVVPRAVWMAARLWYSGDIGGFGEMPFEAHVADWATGSFSAGTVASYVLLSGVALLIATKLVAASRLVGRGARSLRVSTAVVIVLSLAFAVLGVRQLQRLAFTVECAPSGLIGNISARTRGILAESSGDITVTCLISRDDPQFRPTVRLMRTLRRVASSVGGARIDLRYVDPRWDLASAERLAARGIAEDAVVFEKGRRLVVLPVKSGIGERVCASTIRRLTVLPQRRSVYWTTGHGEAALDGYGAFGFSDVVRELSREGYQNRNLDLTTVTTVPTDCALVVIAGPRDGFSRIELDRLDGYLREGGRLLACLDATASEGLSSLLTSWGMRPVAVSLAGAKTLTGSDVIAGNFADHPISAPLRGFRLVFDRPVGFAPSAAVGAGTGVDRIEFTPLVRSGNASLAAVVERGTGAGDDLAIRPTRIVALGDATFAMNGSLAAKANANLDFLLNSIAYLAGTEVTGSSGTDAGVIVTGLDRDGRMRFAVVSSGIVPLLVFLLFSLLVRRRRSRS